MHGSVPRVTVGADRRSSLRKNKGIRYAFIPQLHHKTRQKKNYGGMQTFAHPNYPKMLQSVTGYQHWQLPAAPLSPGSGFDDRDPHYINQLRYSPFAGVCCVVEILTRELKRRVSIFVLPSSEARARKTVLASAACPVKCRLPIQKHSRSLGVVLQFGGGGRDSKFEFTDGQCDESFGFS